MARAVLDGLHETWSHRHLLSVLTVRELRVRYKQTYLGILWAILQPLAAALVIAVVVGRLAAPRSAGEAGAVPYALFALAGFVPWTLVATALNTGGTSLLSHEALVTKVYFPRLFIPLSAVLCAVVDFLVALVPLVVGTAWLVQAAHPAALVWRIAALVGCSLLCLVVASSVALLLAALTVHFRDLKHTLPFLSQVWFLASPIAYPSALVTERGTLLSWAYCLNPMVLLVDGTRWAVLGTVAPSFLTTVLGLATASALLIVSFATFQGMQRSLPDVI